MWILMPKGAIMLEACDERPPDFHDLVTRSLARLASGTSEEIDDHLQTGLCEIGEFMGVDNAYIVRTANDHSEWSITHEWTSPNSPALKDDYQHVRMGAWAHWAEQQILSGQVLCLSRLADIPPEGQDVRQRLETLGFKSTLQVPLRRPGGQVSGCIALTSFTEELTWKPADVRRLRLVAEVIPNATERARMEKELRSALAEVKRLTEQLQAENVYLQEEITKAMGFDEIVGESPALRHTLTQAEHVAKTGSSVLLLGETGTGKELLARAIHDHSDRKHRPLVKVNLAAMPATLIESELFGHVKGAFTGAIADKTGRFQLADGGTLFLDEIGELDPELQTKLLRVLQEGEFERIGTSQTIRVDVRIVAATNRDLRQAIDQGAFRSDLFYRLAVFPIDVPPLRLRREDIPFLTWHFIGKKQGRLGTTIKNVPDDVMQALTDYDWPGNVRELENVIERAMILSPGTTLNLHETLDAAARSANRSPVRPSIRDQREEILAALKQSHWKIKGGGNAAERLGLSPSTLRYRMKTLGIHRPRAR
jgi:transcriptional regulator with GAF, ATPase, and Fis domain